MLAETLAAVEGSGLAAYLRGSTWVYPLINAAHIAGIALLFGAIASFDLRLMGAWRLVPLHALRRVLVPVAATGLAVAAIAGGLLFIAAATEYAASPFFLVKMLMLCLGLGNVLAYHLVARRRGWGDPGHAPAAPVPLQRFLGATSLTVWLSVLVLGRLVGYF